MTCWPGAEDHCIQSLHVFHPARPHNPGHCIILTSILLHTIVNSPAYYTQLVLQTVFHPSSILHKSHVKYCILHTYSVHCTHCILHTITHTTFLLCTYCILHILLHTWDSNPPQGYRYWCKPEDMMSILYFRDFWSTACVCVWIYVYILWGNSAAIRFSW